MTIDQTQVSLKIKLPESYYFVAFGNFVYVGRVLKNVMMKTGRSNF